MRKNRNLRALLNILLSLDEHSATEQYTRKIKFLNVKEGKNKQDGLIYSASGNSVEGLYDPWGNPFTVELAKPGDEDLHFTYRGKTIRLPRRRVAVYVAGPDKVPGSSDDIMTWSSP